MAAAKVRRAGADNDQPVSHDSDHTRDRLIRAAIEIVATEGVAALTTVNVCRRVGIAQSSYYTHFESREALVQAVGEVTQAHSRTVYRSARGDPDERPGADRIRSMFRAAVDDALSQPGLFRLIFQALCTPADTPLGRHGREMADLNRAELAEFLIALGRADEAHAPRSEMYADCINSLVSTLIVGHLDGRYPDIEEILDLLVFLAMPGRRFESWLGWEPVPSH